MGRKSPIYGHQIMSKFISYSEIAEEITVKKEPSRIYLFIRFFFFSFFWFQRLVLLMLALLTRCDARISLVHCLSLPWLGINEK